MGGHEGMQWREREMTAWPWEGQGSSAFQKRRGCPSHYHISIGRVWKSHKRYHKSSGRLWNLPSTQMGPACGQLLATFDDFDYRSL